MSEEMKENFGEISNEAPSMATFEWKVPDFFFLPKKVGFYINSPEFHFLDATWCLEVYPNGDTEYDSIGWIDMYLLKENSLVEKHHITFRLGIKDIHGNEYKVCNDEGDFDGNVGWGQRKFLESSKLFKDRCLVESKGIVKFFCMLHAKVNESPSAATQTINLNDFKIPQQNLKELLYGKDDGDIILKVQSKEFRAHRAILRVRSPVFRAMLRHEMKEDINNFVDITDCDETAFEDFLHFMYCGSLEESCFTRIFGLYFVADKYDVAELKAICVEYIIQNISLDTFFDTLTLALKHGDSTMLKHATDFFTENSVEIVENVNWLSFLKDNPVAASELFLKTLKIKTPKNCTKIKNV